MRTVATRSMERPMPLRMAPRLTSFLIALTMSSTAWGQAASTSTRTLEAFVDGVAEAHLRTHRIPGIAISVVHNGEVLFAKGYGYADLERRKPVEGDRTLFRLGSVSKTFIWTAAMMLHDRGLLDLDQDVQTYLAKIRLPNAFDAPVTMNHLMAHRAGFEDTFAVFTYADTSSVTRNDALIADMPARVFPPGARTSYSNWGSALAAQIVEDTAGIPFEAFVTQNILRPLAMDATALKGPRRMPADLRDRLALGYRGQASPAERLAYMQIGPYAPAGAMSATADDMARWMLVHLGRGRWGDVQLMSAQTHRRMWRRRFVDRPAASDVAHGFMTQFHRGLPMYGHGGATSAFYAYMQMIPDLDLGVFVAMNTTTDASLLNDLPRLVVDRVLAARPTHTATVPSFQATRDDDYAGTYLSNRRSFTRFEKLFALGEISLVTTSTGVTIIAAVGDMPQRYAPVAPDTFENRHGGRIFFGRNADDQITYLVGPMGVHSFEKLGPIDHPQTLGIVAAIVLVLSLFMGLGAWRRFGHSAKPTWVGHTLNVCAIAAAAACLGGAASLIMLIITMSTATANDLLEYPPPIIHVLRGFAMAAFVLGGFMLFGVIPRVGSVGMDRLEEGLLHPLCAGAGCPDVPHRSMEHHLHCHDFVTQTYRR